MYLAELNEDNICIGVKMLKNMIEGHIVIEGLNSDLVGRRYEDGKWSEEKELVFDDEITSPTKIELEIEDLKGRQDITDNTILSLMDIILMGGM